MKKRRVLLFAIGLMVSGPACDDTQESNEEDRSSDLSPGSGLEDDYVTESAPLFSLESVMEVEITISEQAWDAVRYDDPGLAHFSDACPAGPRPRSFEWQPAVVRINGTDFGDIEVRKKGLKGSMSATRPSLKLRFGDNRPGGIRRMTLNNASSDLTVSRECLSYDLFQKAGIQAPRCGLAHVTVNGTSLGVYTHIEEVRKPMLSARYGEQAGRESLFEITMADFDERHMTMFEPKGIDEGETADLSELEATAAALDASDDELLDALAQHLDLDQFFTYWAMEVIVAHGDGYAGNQNNSYIYQNPDTGLFEFIPWGTDWTFSTPYDFFGDFTGASGPLPWSVYANGLLCRRLLAHPEGRERYETRLRQLLDEVWNKDALLAKVDTIQATAKPYRTTLPQASEQAVTDLKSFIATHERRIIDELNQGLPTSWDRPENPLLCARVRQTLEGVLATRKNTLDRSPVEIGEGETTMSDGQQSSSLMMTVGNMGIVTDDFGEERVIMQWIFGPVDENNVLLLYVQMPAELFVEGETVQMDFGQAQVETALVDMQRWDIRPLGFVMTGKMTFEKIEEGDNGEVVISFYAPVGEILI